LEFRVKKDSLNKDEQAKLESLNEIEQSDLKMLLLTNAVINSKESEPKINTLI